MPRISWRRLLLMATLLSLSSLPVLADDFSVTARGSWFCVDGTTGRTLPLVGARVELMDSDCDGSEICDDVMGVSYVQPDGTFEIAGKGGDPGSFSWSKPDPYVRVLFTDDKGVRLTDELDHVRGANTPEHDHDNSEGLIDFGRWTTGLNRPLGESTKCGTFLAAKRAYDGYHSLVGAEPPAGHYDVEYWSAVFTGTPWTNVDTTHWPTHFPTGSVNEHEFGHSVRHAFDGDSNHFVWDATRFRYARFHEYCDSKHLAETHPNKEGFAFNEGWAEFWEGSRGSCGPNPADMEIEGNVANALFHLSQCAGVGKAGMTAVLKSAPGSIHSFGEFESKLRSSFPGCGLASSASPLEVATPAVLSHEVLLAAARTEVERLDAAIVALRAELKSASGKKLPCDVTDDCWKAIQVRVRPPILKARIAAATLMKDHVTRSLSPAWSESLNAALKREDLSSFLAPLRRSFDQKLAAIDRQAFADVTAVLDGLPNNASVKAFRDDIRKKSAAFEKGLRERKPLGPHLVPPELTYGDEATKRSE
jgi:hypothetical protein